MFCRCEEAEVEQGTHRTIVIFTHRETMLQGRNILVIIGGGIAAYKGLELIRLFKAAGARVRAILTEGGSEFVTPLSVASLTGEKAYTELFSLTDEAEMGHIRLAREADLIVVAPATANLIKRMAQGEATDLASTTLLAADGDVMICPAMNAEMWAKPSTQRNLKTLRDDGVIQIGPGEGALACGEVGLGRLAEPADILDAVISYFTGQDKPLSGRRAIVTAGPTHEPIDPVRYIANRSSGKQGYAIASALQELGAETILVSGPTALDAPKGVTMIRVETAQEMFDAVQDALPADIAVCVAAVADWRPVAAHSDKLKKGTGGDAAELKLTENPDILKSISHDPQRPKLVIGFAAETSNMIDHARDKLARKGCDWIIANDVSPASSSVQGGAMGGDRNALSIVTKDDIENWPAASKTALAQKLSRKIAHYINT